MDVNKAQRGRWLRGRLRLKAEQQKTENSASPKTERELVFAKLAAAGLLVRPEELGIPDNLEPISDAELEELVELPPDAPPSEVLVDEDRGLY